MFCPGCPPMRLPPGGAELEGFRAASGQIQAARVEQMPERTGDAHRHQPGGKIDVASRYRSWALATRPAASNARRGDQSQRAKSQAGHAEYEMDNVIVL